MPNRSATHVRVQARARSRDPQSKGASHNQPRTWGTRFDSLTSPPGSPESNTSRASNSSSSHVSSRSRSFSPPRSARMSTSASMQSDEFSTRGIRRDWADEEVPASLYISARDETQDANEVATSADSASVHSLNQTGNTYFGRKVSTSRKMPHNASVFIGSLPSDVEEAELGENLANHLGRTANIQSIKIIHDSKGGVCAFVQCETAAQANLVVSNAHTNPQPFMGRMLRYESARARRSLWISYRTPIHFLPCASQSEEGTGIVTDENGQKGRWIESSLPDAMRIWKPREARFPVISYRGEARNAGELSRFDVDISNPAVPPAFTLKGMLFVDLKFDGKSIKKMAECFGPLESFKLFSSGDDRVTCPPEHDTDRCPNMDAGIWEIKWGHRDDCITALNTLKRVPHLTVTWAKDQNYTFTPRPGYIRSPVSPHYPTSYSPREAMSPSVRQRPPLLLDCTKNDRVNNNIDQLSPSPTFTRSPFSTQRSGQRLATHMIRRGGEPMQLPNEGDDAEEGWTVVRPQNITRTIMSSFSGGPGNSPVEIEENLKEGLSKSPEWSDRDFPPLKNVHGATDEKEKLESDEKVNEKSRIGDLPASLNDPSNPVSSSQGVEKDELAPAEIPKTTSVSRPSVVHRRSLSNPIARMQSQSELPPLESNTQVPTSPAIRALEIPPTPELKNASLETPTTATTAQLPTPVYSVIMSLPPESQNGLHNMHEMKASMQHINEDRSLIELDSIHGQEHQHEPTIDPKTIFVGGLETLGPQPWNEERLRSIFEKYGIITEVHIVVPTTKKTAFAFITFEDEQGPQHAIRGEHNRVYDGRQIRVQIRDMFPPRGGYKFRGRGMMRPRMNFDPHIVEHNQFQNINRHERGSISVIRGHSFEQVADRTEARQAVVPFRINTHLPPSISTDTDSTLRSSGSYVSKPDMDSSQESDIKTSMSLTPPPSTMGTSVSTTAVVAPVTPQGIPPAYYPPPQAWPYGAQMHYPLPLGSYGGIVQPLPLPFAAAPQGIDPNGASIQWNHMYRATVPFAPYPYMVVSQTEAARSATTNPQSTNPVKNQPPLHATGFIQGEHGTLIPVYQPDALDEYMNGSTTGHVGGGSASAPVSTQQTGGIFSAPVWPGYAAPPMITYPLQPTTTAGVTNSTPQNCQQQGGNHQSQNSNQAHAQGFVNAYVQPGPVLTTHNVHGTQQGTVAFGHLPQYSQPNSSANLTNGPNIRSNHHHSHMGQHASNMSHERQNNYVNKHPPRRDPNFNNQHGRMHNSVHGPQSPSGARPSSRMGNSHRHQHSNGGTSPFSQRQYHQRQAASPLQLNYNKQIVDGGTAQHQWVANFQH